MSTFLEHILSTSFHGSVVILAVLALRLFLPRMSKKFVCYLWLLAGLRLLMPFEIQSGLSLQPDLTPLLLEYGWTLSLPQWTAELPYLYLAVGFCFLVYTVWTYLGLKRRVRESVRIPGGWECDKIQTSFVLGFLRPRIYIPMNMPEYVCQHILTHERTHLEKGDHWIKMVGFLALAMHWFNPLVWIAYAKLCQDIELACDERVVRFMEEEERRSYASALLCCSSNHAHFAACPVAFGEVSVKGRIFAVMEHRRPGFMQSALSLLAVAFVAICLVTSPTVEKNSLLWARDLALEDIAYMEVTSTREDALDAYQRLEGGQMAPMVALIRSASGQALDTHGFVPAGQETIVLHMTDGSTHTVANYDDKYLVIDQDVYTASTAWLQTWELGGRIDPSQPQRPRSDSPYVRQRWAQDLRVQDIEKIEFTCQAEGLEFARYLSDDMIPWVEMINAIDGPLVKTAQVSGTTEDIYLGTAYVFMEDGSCYTLERIAGAIENYISIGNSIFSVSDEVFQAWPDTGTGPWPQGYTLVNQPPAQEIPLDQRCQVDNIAPVSPLIPRPTGFAAYEWLMALTAEDIQQVEYVAVHDWDTPYHRYTREELPQVVALLTRNTCYAYQAVVDIHWGNFANQEFHIQMNDGSWHKVSSIGTTVVVVDGTAFSVTSEWIMSWPETGTDPWPQDFEVTLENREYYIETDEQSIFSTTQFENERNYLDHSYNTNREMGSVSRSYPVGTWGVTLAAHSANATSLILTAEEFSANRSGSLTIGSRFWLEQWQEDAVSPGSGTYEKIVPAASPAMDAQTLGPRQKREWFVSWSESYGRLSPGCYRIALVFQDGEKETICYAKFEVT